MLKHVAAGAASLLVLGRYLAPFLPGYHGVTAAQIRDDENVKQLHVCSY
jgi:hypothetical protein